MQISHLSKKTTSNSNLDPSIQRVQEKLTNELKGLPFKIENFKKQIQLKQRSYPANNREVLWEVLNSAYKNGWIICTGHLSDDKAIGRIKSDEKGFYWDPI